MKLFWFLYFLFLGSAAYSLPLPLSASLGDSGRAGYGSADYHLLNSASLLNGSIYQAGAFYFFKGKNKIYGGSLTNRKDLPIGVAWIRTSPKNNYQVFSIAGKLSQKFLMGVGIHRHSENNDFFPHLGILYKPIEKLTLGFTGDRINNRIKYGMGLRFDFTEFFLVQGDVVYEKDDFLFGGGVEFITENQFSFRLGQVWPHPSFRIGISFNGYPIKLDYTWIQKQGHTVGFRITAD